MNERGEEVLRAVLLSLGGLTNAQMTESVLHYRANLWLRNTGLEGATLTEFEASLRWADDHRWVHGVRGETGRMRWSITDLGRAGLADMNA